MNGEYIYMIKLREFIKSNENVYKVGKSKQNGCNRTRQYPKGSLLECVFRVSNCDVAETKLLELFNKKYKKRSDYGNEYFEGDRELMVVDIYNLVQDFKPLKTTTIIQEKEQPIVLSQNKMDILKSIENKLLNKI